MLSIEKKFTFACIGMILAGTLLLTVGIKSCYTITDEISDRGLKNVVEEIWEGKQETIQGEGQ